ncbi:hypothetical protein ACFO6V_28030 [Promicromonospora alba]|uniref:TetR family transcriptional regulator n=1 Tax=Promicromonospora alba TaxID=1616110 RepID=A0ABV9HPJ3_9MICO
MRDATQNRAEMYQKVYEENELAAPAVAAFIDSLEIIMLGHQERYGVELHDPMVVHEMVWLYVSNLRNKEKR